MTDEYLMQRVAEGDLNPAATLYERYKRLLFNFFWRYGLGKENAQDLTQQVFVRVLQYRQSYKAEFAFKTWIYRIARNVYHDYLKANPMKVSDLEQFADLLPEAESNEEDLRLVQKSLQYLSDEYREVLILSKYEEMKYEQIAEVLGITVALVKVRVHRAIKQLREIYFQLA